MNKYDCWYFVMERENYRWDTFDWFRSYTDKEALST